MTTPLPVEWSAAAAEDLERIHAHLIERSPAAARRVVAEIGAATELLELFPHSGRPGRAAGTRELVSARPWVVVYEVEAEAVLILHIYHAAQDR